MQIAMEINLQPERTSAGEVQCLVDSQQQHQVDLADWVQIDSIRKVLHPPRLLRPSPSTHFPPCMGISLCGSFPRTGNLFCGSIFGEELP